MAVGSAGMIPRSRPTVPGVEHGVFMMKKGADDAADPDLAELSHRTGILTGSLVRQVVAEFAINPKGHHGTAHWMRVRANGLLLAEETGANTKVIEAFALFHDSKRLNEYEDPEHGKRGADNAEKYWRQGALDLDAAEFKLVHSACWGHTCEDIEDPCITILTCWDADRLDLGRVGIEPDPARLFTGPAKRRSMIDWAFGRSMQWLEQYQ